ncbi:CAMK family protein kinase [Tritrichomonas foetus]|uniref:CAMK family protein kinase n=1 Tax=Tritrichomonas foetus TaxID=1144522 RepID=A0A1J4K3R9_9EUKA|nr:CAMK family protein kinase [Tritrichomonas foetus]|eukprot:OHT06089.1 CAMK family protein kinase [Tritrichomonas foetus]
MGEMVVILPTQIGPYLFQGVIGEGAFSVVRLVRHVDNGNYFACKVVPRSRIQTARLKARFEAEIRINQQLHFPGIVEMYDLLSDENNYYIIMEFCPNGELFQYIVDRQKLSETEAQPIFRQILETLEYVHKMGISHRDMKPENLLIDKVGHIKISDFGLSRFIKQNGLVDTPCGSPCYASPECISGKPYDGITTDVWSSGVILYAMLTGQLPWTKRNQAQLFQQIKKGEYVIPNFLSHDCQDFLKQLLTVDNKQRITIPEAYQHPWLVKTPPILPFMPYPNSTVSIRMVDEFFGYKMSALDFKYMDIERKLSLHGFSVRKIIKMISLNQESSGTKIKRRKKKVAVSCANVPEIPKDIVKEISPRLISIIPEENEEEKVNMIENNHNTTKDVKFNSKDHSKGKKEIVRKAKNESIKEEVVQHEVSKVPPIEQTHSVKRIRRNDSHNSSRGRRVPPQRVVNQASNQNHANNPSHGVNQSYGANPQADVPRPPINIINQKISPTKMNSRLRVSRPRTAAGNSNAGTPSGGGGGGGARGSKIHVTKPHPVRSILPR